MPPKSVRWNKYISPHNITKNRGEVKLKELLNQLNNAKALNAKKRDLKHPHVPTMIGIPNFFVYYTKNDKLIHLKFKDEKNYINLYKKVYNRLKISQCEFHYMNI